MGEQEQQEQAETRHACKYALRADWDLRKHVRNMPLHSAYSGLKTMVGQRDLFRTASLETSNTDREPSRFQFMTFDSWADPTRSAILRFFQSCLEPFPKQEDHSQDAGSGAVPGPLQASHCQASQNRRLPSFSSFWVLRASCFSI